MQIALTPDQIAAAVANIKKSYKINVALPSGQITRQGVTLTYIYDGSALLHISVTKKPFFVEESYVESQIAQWFSAQAAPAEAAR
jgi:hypothetical protein